MTLKIVEFVGDNDFSPFAEWFNDLDSAAAARVTVYINRLSQGNFSNVKSVGSGVMEIKIDYGPGYRVYFGKENEQLVILLGGGTKKTQPKDIEAAKKLWLKYKQMK